MLAQNRHEGSESTRRPAAKRKSRQPTTFMFIDSSNGGVNAKPDRVVRSFVMKSARHRKSWSTKPRSPAEEDFVETRFPKQTSVQIASPHGGSLDVRSLSPRDYHRNSLPWDNRSLGSPATSRRSSVFSNYSGSRTCDSPSSCYTSPFAEHSSPEHAYAFPVEQQDAITSCNSFDIGFTRSFDCLPVCLEAHTQRLLHQCKQLLI